VRNSADREDSRGSEAAEGASGCTRGADSGDRGKRLSVPAVRLAEVIAMLDAGDVAGARAAVRVLIEQGGDV
jgi:hypothetical protein